MKYTLIVEDVEDGRVPGEGYSALIMHNGTVSNTVRVTHIYDGDLVNVEGYHR